MYYYVLIDLFLSKKDKFSEWQLLVYIAMVFG